jgi:hypothetical protein
MGRSGSVGGLRRCDSALQLNSMLDGLRGIVDAAMILQMTVKKPNETNALDALLRILPSFTGCTYRLESSPDSSNSISPDADFLLAVAAGDCRPLAIEHTVVEAFRGQNTYVRKSYEIVARLNEACRGSIPADRSYALGISPHLAETLDERTTGSFVSGLVDWTVKTAAQLHETEHRYNPDLDNQVLLMCQISNPETAGSIGRVATSPKEAEQLALVSLRFAVEHGLKKLAKYKRSGHDTLLILEDISGATYPSMLIELTRDARLQSEVTEGLDYIVEFAANEGRMISAHVWKDREFMFDEIPEDWRFSMDKDWPRQNERAI